MTSTVTLRCRRDTYGTGLALVTRLVLVCVDAVVAALGDTCVAGVVLGDIDRHFAWQAWHLLALAWLW